MYKKWHHTCRVEFSDIRTKRILKAHKKKKAKAAPEEASQPDKIPQSNLTNNFVYSVILTNPMNNYIL